MIELRTSVFVSVSNEVLQYKEVCVKFDSNILQTMSFITKYTTGEKKMRVDSIPGPQLQNVFNNFGNCV